MPKTPGPVESSTGRSNPYIKTGINKSLLTPFRRVGLSKTRKTTNNLNLSIDSNLNTSATSSEASPLKPLSLYPVEKAKLETVGNKSITKTGLDADISTPKYETSVDVARKSVEKVDKCNAREGKPEENRSITSSESAANAYEKQSTKGRDCSTAQSVEINAATYSNNNKESNIKHKRKRSVKDGGFSTSSNESTTITPDTEPEKMFIKQDKPRTTPRLENRSGTNNKTANKRKTETVRHVSSDDSEDEPLVNIIKNETSVSSFVDPVVGNENIKATKKRRIKRILSEDSEENFSAHDTNINKDQDLSDSQKSMFKTSTNRSDLSEKSNAEISEKLVKHISEDFAATPSLLGFDDLDSENAISDSSFNSNTKNRFKPNASCEHNYPSTEPTNQRNSNSASDVSQTTGTNESDSEEKLSPVLEMPKVQSSQDEQFPKVKPEHMKTQSSHEQPSLLVNKPKKTYMKRSLSMKKSSSQQITDEVGMIKSNTVKGCSVKLTKVQLPADQKLFEVMDFDIKRETELISKFEQQVTEKRKLFEELKQAEVYQKKHNVSELKQLTLAWKNGCISALNDLLPLLQQHGDINMERLLQNLKIPSQFVSLSPSGELT